jgi:class 3 adenylate cyclase
MTNKNNNQSNKKTCVEPTQKKSVTTLTQNNITKKNSAPKKTKAKNTKKDLKKTTSHSELVTLLFVDIANYTQTTNELSRDLFDKLHDNFDHIVTRGTEVFNGTIIKKIGDAFLITFKTATDAVLCGIELQNNAEKLNKDPLLKREVKLRVALHTGEVIWRDGDVYGDPVNMASRLEGLAKPGDVIFSETVYFAMNKSEIDYQHIGQRKVKGSKTPIRVFRVKNESDILREQRYARKKKYYKKKKREQQKMFLSIVLTFGSTIGILLLITLILALI